MGIEMIFGEQAEFAISITPQSDGGPLRMSECIIWLHGKPLGDARNAIFTESFLRALQGLVKAKPNRSAKPKLAANSSEFLSMTKGGQIADIDQHLFLLISGFDDFLKLFYKDQSTTTFIWALHPACLSRPEYSHHNDGVYSDTIFNSTINRVVAEAIDSGI